MGIVPEPSSYPDESGDEGKYAGCDVCAVKCWTFEGLVGKVSSLGYLCTPEIPCLKKTGTKPPLFMGKDEKLPLLISIFMGL